MSNNTIWKNKQTNNISAKSEHLCLSSRFHPSSSVDSAASHAPGAVGAALVAPVVVVAVQGR